MNFESPMGEPSTPDELGFRLAQPKDEPRIATFLSGGVFEGPLDLTIQRPPSVFRVYRALGETTETYLVQNKEGEILACLTLLYRTTYLRRQLKKTAWMTDLRVITSKQALKSVSLHLLELLKRVRDQRGIEHFFAILSNPQELALTTFIRPRSTRTNLPRFYQVRKFGAVCVHGKFPEFRENRISVNISAGIEQDWPKILEYMEKKSEAQLVGTVKTRASLEREFSLENKMDPSSFLIAKDLSGQIVGLVCLRDGATYHHIQISRYHGFSKTLKKTFAWLSLFGWVERLPRLRHTLALCYMTHLYSDNPDIFLKLVQSTLKFKKKGSLLIFLNFEEDPTTVPTFPLITTQFPFSLYSLVLPDETAPMFLRTSPLEPAPDLDPTMI